MVSRLARLCCWRQKFDVYNERLSSSLFSIPTGVGVKKRFCFRHRSAFRLLVDVLLFSFQGSCVGHCFNSNSYILANSQCHVNKKFYLFSFTSSPLNEQPNKFISLTNKSQHNTKSFLILIQKLNLLAEY